MSSPQPAQLSQYKRVKTDYDLFSLLFKQGNDYLDQATINSFVTTQNIPMLIESVCHVLDICDRYGENINTVVNSRNPTLVGNRFALKSVIDALGINQGRIDSSSEYTIALISLVFTFNPESIHFVSLLRSSKNWTAKSFRNAFISSPFFSFFRQIQEKMPFIPFSLITRLKIAKSIELGFIKYTKVIPKASIKGIDTSNSNDISLQPGANPHSLNILTHVKTHHIAFVSSLEKNENIKKNLPNYFLEKNTELLPKNEFFDDSLIDLPIHIPTCSTEFLTYFVYSPFAGYGLDIKAFTDQIPQVLLRYLSMAIQSYNFEAFKFLLSLDLFMNISGEDDYIELQTTEELDKQQAIYNRLGYGDRFIDLANPLEFDLKLHTPQAVRVGNMITEGVVTQVLQKYTCFEKINKIADQIGGLGIEVNNLKEIIAQKSDNNITDQITEKLYQIKTLKLKAETYYNQAQLIIRFHEGLWSLYRYDLATPSQLIILFIAAYCYQDDIILSRLQNTYNMSLDDLMDYDNSTHMDKFQNDELKIAYKNAIGDQTFKAARKTLIYDIFYSFSTHQLPRCIEYYVFKIKRKKAITDLTLPLNPLAVAITCYDVEIDFLEFLIEKGSPFIPHSRFGDQYNIILSLLRSTYDQSQDRTIELLDWCKKYTAEKTNEQMAITMDEFFAFMAKITRLPVQPPTIPAQIEKNIQDQIETSGYGQAIIVPSIPIGNDVALKLYPQQCGYRTKVMKWVWDNALTMSEWRTQVLSTPDVVIKALQGLLQVNEPTPLTFSQNSVEFLKFEDELLQMIKFFIVKENAAVIFLNQKFTGILAQLVSHRSVRIFKYLFDLGYVLDKQMLYLFAMSPATFNSYNDYNIYIPTYRELVTRKCDKNIIKKSQKEVRNNNDDKIEQNWVKKWQGLEDKRLPILAKGKISSAQHGARLISEAEFILDITRGQKGKAKGKVPKLPEGTEPICYTYVKKIVQKRLVKKVNNKNDGKAKGQRLDEIDVIEKVADDEKVVKGVNSGGVIEEEVQFDQDGVEIDKNTPVLELNVGETDKIDDKIGTEKNQDDEMSQDKDEYEEIDEEVEVEIKENVQDEDWDSIDWENIDKDVAKIKIEKLKLIYRQFLENSLIETEKNDEKINSELLTYPIHYDYLPERLPPQCPKFQSLHRFNLASKHGLAQLLSSGLLVDYKKEDVLAKCSIPKLQFDSLEPICLPNHANLYAQVKSRSQVELMLSKASKEELGKCCWTVLQYLYETYFIPYEEGLIPFEEQSLTLHLFLLLLQHCPDVEYALYMLMTPIDSVGFISSCFQWLLYKIVVETFPTARIPFSLLGKLFLLQNAPSRPNSCLTAHLSTSLMFEDVIRHGIEGFNKYTISEREDLSEENDEIYKKILINHSQSLKKAIRQQQLTGKEVDIAPEPPSLYELGLQEYKYKLKYHGSETHFFEKKSEFLDVCLDEDSPLHVYSPLAVIDKYPSPILPGNEFMANLDGKKQFINQKYFNMLSFDSQFSNSFENVSNNNHQLKNNNEDNNGANHNGIFVSHIAQRALIALVSDLLYQYKLDEDVGKELQTHRDIRECGKNTTSRAEFISSLSIFRRIFNYIHFIPLQIVFFISHLVPTTDLYMYFDLFELQAFFTQAGRDGLFNQDAMFLCQPLQYHVYPITKSYKSCITDNLALLYEFNAQYALNKVDDNVKIMSGEMKKDKEKNEPNPNGENDQKNEQNAELIPAPELSRYNMANFYTMYYESVIPPPKSNKDIYRVDLIPQRNNALVPYLLVDLDGSLLVNEDAERPEDVYRSELPNNEMFQKLPLLWPSLCEGARSGTFGDNLPPQEIPAHLMQKIDPNQNLQVEFDSKNEIENSTKIEQIEQISQNHNAPSNKNGGYLIPISIGLASLAGLAAGAFYLFTQQKHSDGSHASASQPKRTRKRPTQQPPANTQ